MRTRRDARARTSIVCSTFPEQFLVKHRLFARIGISTITIIDGILHYGNGTEPQGLDPHVVSGIPENHIVRAIFEGLAVKNPYTLEPEPGVAERWDISDDGLTVTFYLNPQARRQSRR